MDGRRRHAVVHWQGTITPRTMATYLPAELAEILRLHRLWSLNEGGKSGIRANLSGANLNGANLNGVNLSRANISRANLHWANLRWANLNGANLNGADLSGANLSWADLNGADLSGANLSGANLNGANLNGVNLIGADLSRADLNGADLNGADLSWANLSGANFRGANLSGAIGLPIAADAPARLLAVAEAALATPDALKMCSWHQCETTHCICGWAEHLGSPLANLIIKIYGNDVGGLMLLGVKAHAHFYSSNKKARAFLQSVIDNATATEVQ